MVVDRLKRSKHCFTSLETFKKIFMKLKIGASESCDFSKQSFIVVLGVDLKQTY